MQSSSTGGNQMVLIPFQFMITAHYLVELLQPCSHTYTDFQVTTATIPKNRMVEKCMSSNTCRCALGVAS